MIFLGSIRGIGLTLLYIVHCSRCLENLSKSQTSACMDYPCGVVHPFYYFSPFKSDRVIFVLFCLVWIGRNMARRRYTLGLPGKSKYRFLQELSGPVPQRVQENRLDIPGCLSAG